MSRLVATFVFLLAVVATCQAGTVVYSFSGITASSSPPIELMSFQYTAPQFITSNQEVLLSQLDSCVNCGTPPIPADPVLFFRPNSCDSSSCFDFLQFNKPKRHE